VCYRHCERSEAIRNPTRRHLDCFVASLSALHAVRNHTGADFPSL